MTSDKQLRKLERIAAELLKVSLEIKKEKAMTLGFTEASKLEVVEKTEELGKLLFLKVRNSGNDFES